MLSRRRALKTIIAVAASAGAARNFGAEAEDMVSLPIGNGERPLVTYPGKRPLIRLTTRPPQLETPFSVFNEGSSRQTTRFSSAIIWPRIPTTVDPETFRLKVEGAVDLPLRSPWKT